MATADFSHAERRAGPGVAHAATDAHAHDAHGAHGAHDTHGAHGAHAHDHHHDVAGDKKAAFVGLVGGMALIAALMYGMVLWTNAQFAGHEGGAKAAATSTH